MTAFSSHQDIPDITASDANEVFRWARDRAVVAIVIINNVTDTAVEDKRRLQLDTPNVHEHFEKVRQATGSTTSSDVVLEVNAFAVDGETAKLAWSGVTAVFSPNTRDEAIEELSDSIAAALRTAQHRVRSEG